MKSRRKVSLKMAARYRRADRRQKGQILDGFCRLTDYNRVYAAWLLRHIGKRHRVKAGAVEAVAVHHRKPDRRGRPRVYGQAVVRALTGLWMHFGCLCGMEFPRKNRQEDQAALDSYSIGVR